MAKRGEIEYLSRLGPDGARHARDKPFSDEHCGALLVDMGGLLTLLPPPPARVLDLGCGSGWTSAFLARRGYEVTGQDIAADMIALAESGRARESLANLRFVTSDYESLEFREEFDAAVFYDSLHHAVDPAAALAGAWRALKPGAVLITFEPGAGHAKTEAARQAVAAYDVTERDMPPRLVVELAARAGFRDARVHPMPKTLTALQYEAVTPGWLPRRLEPLYRWLLIGWVTLPGLYRYGGTVVLRK